MTTEQICVICSSKFIRNAKTRKYVATCSGSCAGKLRHQNMSPDAKQRRELAISQSKLAEKNVNWIGDKVGYTALHAWVQRRYHKPDNCENCHKVTTVLDLANISQEYKRDLGDWEYLCRSCHMKKDGRLSTLQENHRLWNLSRTTRESYNNGDQEDD